VIVPSQIINSAYTHREFILHLYHGHVRAVFRRKDAHIWERDYYLFWV